MTNDLEAQGLADIPVEAIKTLIDMIRGATEFNLIRAIEAGLEVAKWALQLFGSSTSSFQIASDSERDRALAVGLESLIPSGAVSTQALPFPREVLIEMLLKWLFDWLNRRING
jgi:hypothetical protein